MRTYRQVEKGERKMRTYRQVEKGEKNENLQTGGKGK